MNYEQSDNPDQLKEDIERTRNRMSQKINTIQERLDPENLRSQAQDAVRGVMTDSADALVGYVKEHSRDLGETVMDTIKKYPVQSALIGIGVGWLLVERMTGSGESGNGSRYNNSQSYRGSSYGGSYSSQTGYERSGYDTPSAYDTPSYGGAQSVPVYDQYGRRQGNPGVRYNYASQEGGGQDLYRGSQSGSYAYEQSGSQPSGGQGLMENAQEAVEQIGDKVKQSVQGVQSAAARVGSTVQDFASDMRERGGQLGGQAQNVGSQAQYYGSQAQRQAQRAGYRVQENIETNPLVFGAVALAVGAAVGMMLPSTRREDQMFGQWRDEVVHRAQEVAGDVRERAQQVVEEVKPELQQTVEKVKQDLSQTGRSAIQDLQQTGKEVVQDIRHTASTAEHVAKEGSKPKMGGEGTLDNQSQKNPTP